MSLLAADFPDWKGFENTSFLSKFSRYGSRFIQILHDGDNHWVTAASDKEGEVVLYDSLKGASISSAIYSQISTLSNCKLKSLRIIRAGVQQQSNGTNCGLFSIAFAVDIAFGITPKERAYAESEMRNHLLKCFKNRKMSPFPQVPPKHRGIKKSKDSILIEDVHCTCRRIYITSDMEKDPGFFMAMCSVCEEWYHKKCLKIPPKVFKSNNAANNWKCLYCL